MKSKTSPRSILFASGSALLLASPAHSANFYWDTNGNTAGLGDTAGTWGTSAFWGNMNAGNSRIVIDGTQNTANSAIGAADTVYFGTVNLGLGATASTIGVVGGGVTVNRIVFGAGQGSQGVTLSSGGGTITLGGTTPSIYANNTGTNTIGAVLNGTAGLVYGGSGTTRLTGANGFTGGVTVTGGGTLQVGNGTSGSLTSQALTFNNGGGIFNVRSADAGSTQAMGTLTFANTGTTVGEGTVQSTYGTSGNAEVSFSSLAARQAGATGNFVISGGTNGTTNKIVLTGAATGFLDKGLYFNGSSYAAYDAGGFVRGIIYGADANTAATDTITAGNHVQLTSSPAARAGDTLLSLNLSGGGVNYTMSSGSLTVPAILKSGGGAVSTISGGTSVTTAGNAELVIRTDTSSDLLNISSSVTGFNGGLTKTGEGTLTLSGTNGYTGATRINQGILAVSGGSAIADNQAVILANASGATFQLNGDETISSVTGGGISGGNVNVQGNTLTLSNNGSYAFGGQFTGTGAGGVIKQGNGTLTLSNKNTFAGTITVSAGTLAFSYGNDGSSDELLISSGGAISMNNGTTLSFVPATNLAAGVIGSQLQVGKGWIVGNDINVAAGTATLNFTQNDNRWAFTGDVSGSSTPATPTTLAILTGSGNDREVITFDGVIQDGSGGGSLGLDITARGNNVGTYINLANSNTFTGPITITTTSNNSSDGYLVIGGERTNTSFTTGSGSLGTGGIYSNTISLLQTGSRQSILNYASSADQTLGGEISGTGKLQKDGAGTLTLSTDNSYTGATEVNSGSLIINGSTSSTSIVSVASGATLGGNGIVGGNTTILNNGTLSPGTSPGTLTFTNDLTLNNGAIYALEAGDLTAVGQTLTLTDNWTLALGSGFQNGGSVTIFTYGIAGGFDLAPTFNTDNLGFTPSGSLTLTDTGSSIVLNGISVIPEPSAALLGALGLLALLRRRR